MVQFYNTYTHTHHALPVRATGRREGGGGCGLQENHTGLFHRGEEKSTLSNRVCTRRRTDRGNSIALSASHTQRHKCTSVNSSGEARRRLKGNCGGTHTHT